jgi:hypothetical protein
VVFETFTSRRNWFEKCNQWIEMDFTSEFAFTQVGVQASTSSFDSTDSVELAWINVEREDSSWEPWQTYSSSTSRTLLHDLSEKSFYQFQIESGADTNSGASPIVKELKWYGNYQSEGYLNTNWYDTSEKQWSYLVVDGELPTDCSLRASSRANSEMASFTFLSSEQKNVFLIHEDLNTSRIQFGLHLTCSNSRVTPRILGLRLTNEKPI